MSVIELECLKADKFWNFYRLSVFNDFGLRLFAHEFKLKRHNFKEHKDVSAPPILNHPYSSILVQAVAVVHTSVKLQRFKIFTKSYLAYNTQKVSSWRLRAPTDPKQGGAWAIDGTCYRVS